MAVTLAWIAAVLVIPLILGIYVMQIQHWDLNIPLVYGKGDDIWQLVLTKVLTETGWVLNNPFLGAPDIASWHHNAAAQTSALHSILMLGLSFFISDAVKVQQIYYLLNFSLISATSFYACRLIGIRRLPALCVGLLYAFTTFRLGFLFYAFLSNYFMVPLALVAVMWTMSGVYQRSALSIQTESGAVWLRKLLVSRTFLLGLLFIVLTTLSDGYYAFFTLLLLGFATFARIIRGDLKSPLSFAAPLIYIGALIAVALALSAPLSVFKRHHMEEFFPGGKEDASLIKHPFEAEVYSTSLKMMLAPIPNHRLEALGKIGNQIAKTSDAARQYPNGRNIMPLGSLVAVLFAWTLIRVCLPTRSKVHTATNVAPIYQRPESSFLPLVCFIFLCSIFGGVGTLIALVYPTIRAYDRFPLFLIFVLLVYGAHYASRALKDRSRLNRAAVLLLLLALTVFGLWDQIPKDAAKIDSKRAVLFMAERDFVKSVESELPTLAMVYQYPYSQYLRDSKYYGWGSFSHVRLYLHSKGLRWSNGGAKNSPGDDWNLRTSHLPFDELLVEIEALGFKGLVIDRTVVEGAEYEGLRNVIVKRGYTLREDAASNLAFVKLRDPGFVMTYGPDYKELLQITVTNGVTLVADAMPRLVDPDVFKKYMNASTIATGTVLTRATHPDLFFDAEALTRGMGYTAILPITDMVGQMRCDVRKSSKPGVGSEVILTLTNESQFDWTLNQGPYPIRVGVHALGADGAVIRWDGGFRTTSDAYVKRGKSVELTAPLDAVSSSGLTTDLRADMLQFELVQDGNAWFNKINCRIAAPAN